MMAYTEWLNSIDAAGRRAEFDAHGLSAANLTLNP
jgi:hypothetical protein